MLAAIEQQAESSTPIPVCLWEENPYRLVSLWDMLLAFGKFCWVCCDLLKTSASAFAGIADDLSRGRSGDDFDRWRHDRYKYAKDSLRALSMTFSGFGMPVTISKSKRLLEKMEAGSAPSNDRAAGALALELQSFVEVVGTELDAIRFLYVPPGKQPYCSTDPLPPLAEAVANRFDDALSDAIEASRCYGFGRNTACVFHCMRVLEVGLQAISKASGIIDARPNWDPVIKRVDKLLKMDSDYLKKNPQERIPEIHENVDFYAGCSAHFHAVKIAWRNRVMHIERSYGDQDAFDIMNATQGLMAHLAPRLGTLQPTPSSSVSPDPAS